MIKQILIGIFTLLNIQMVSAQILFDSVFNSDFAAQVKSIDEFINRFNGTEMNKQIKNDSTGRRNNIIALFDYQMNHLGLSNDDFKSFILNFVNLSIKSGIKLKITDSAIWAEAKSSIKVEGKKKTIAIILKSETYKENRVRWAIAGVRGLAEEGIINTTKYRAISPVEHEIHFMTLDEIFHNNTADIMDYRSKDATIDELSVFLTLVMTKKIEFDRVEKLTIHCLEVPGYIFTINEQGRTGNNSGWLISNLMLSSDNEKKQYTKKLLNK